MNDVRVESIKGGVAVAGAGTAIITLNELVATATLMYIVVQLVILLHKHYWNIQDRKAK